MDTNDLRDPSGRLNDHECQELNIHQEAQVINYLARIFNFNTPLGSVSDKTGIFVARSVATFPFNFI
jgi:hypothetical protein